MENPWLQDLQFLIATDDQLQEELVHVCEILEGVSATSLPDDSTPSPTSETFVNPEEKSSSETTKRQRYYKRQRDEIHHLRQQVDQLTALLQRKQRCGRTDESLWERTAIEELAEKTKSMEENAFLREAVGQQATFIEQMQRVFRKKPRLTSHIDIHSEEWKYYKLAAHASLREATIHAIADRQYHRMQSAMVKAGVFDRETNLFQVKAISQPDHSYVLEAVHHVDLNAPFRLLGAAAWNVFEGGHPVDLPLHAVQDDTHIDPYTVYSTCMQERNGMTWHSNMVRKYYTEPDREVIVSRTVLEDAALPHMTKGAIEDRCMWCVNLASPLKQRVVGWLSRHCQMSPTAVGSRFCSIYSDALARLKKIPFQFFPTRPGQIPLTSEIDFASLPYPKMAAFVERGIRFSDTLKLKLNAVIENFHEQLLQ
ncbi:hypothetical protein LEN26_013113 [Aphanomyces euteiches]|nr:hypothetical protein LEN26_013113 [Aphanomyces euteiches]